MYCGKIVEVGTVDQLMAAPLHPYTQTLLSAIPVVRESERALIPQVEARDGELPSFDPTRHCSFYSRCPSRRPQCLERAHPVLVALPDGRKVSCHAAAPPHVPLPVGAGLSHLGNLPVIPSGAARRAA